MALATNTTTQLANRLNADLGLRFPGYKIVSTMAGGPAFTTTQSLPDANDNLLSLTNSGGTVVAIMALSRRHYNGFNVVAELSSSAGEGLPEHVVYALILAAASQTVVAQIVMTATQLGASSVVFGFNATMNEATMTLANMPNEFNNSSRSGASGQ